ncbi:winged helix-turn-helix transcriptional regulator [Saccharopolyspora shandongensis]|uniref:winged helix-turn-helix transcriptional regulator n=1 Tax=Saccharopolyspora shandongensis TaxID=418495 RepID=UPI0033C505C9
MRPTVQPLACGRASLRPAAVAEVPPRVEYALTPLGQSLSDTVTHVVRWVQEHQVEIARNREAFEGTEPAAS